MCKRTSCSCEVAVEWMIVIIWYDCEYEYYEYGCERYVKYSNESEILLIFSQFEQ